MKQHIESSKKIILQRIDMTLAGTIGKLLVDGEFVCFTVELPWRNNARDVSCIPAGQYDLRYYDSPTKGSKLHVTGVRNRSYILFHPANYQHECRGCIFPASHVTRYVDGKNVGYAGIDSRIACDALEERLPRNDLQDGDEHYVLPYRYKISVRDAMRYE